MRLTKKAFSMMIGAALVACTAFGLVGCGQQGSESTSGGSGGDAASESGMNEVLVVYYSATGNTEAIAEYIASQTTADTFQIVADPEYTSADLNYNDADSRVSKEHADASLQDVKLQKDTPDGWESYSTVFIGYPIWWGEAAWPVTSFVKANDFTGKTVIPFCTSASSGLGNSAQELSQAATGGEWLGGMRFPSHVDDDEVLQWIEDLGEENQSLSNMD